MLSEDHSKYKILDQLLLNNQRFAIYRLPSSKELCLILQLQTDKEPSISNDFFSLSKKQGFIVSPFSISTTNPIVIISPDIVIKGEAAIFDFLSSKYLTDENFQNQELQSRPKDKGLDSYLQYQSIFNIFHGKIEENIVSKLVLSRTKDLPQKEDFSIGIVFKEAIKEYPDNFVYLCNTPESGAWLGCSPEILLSGRENQWKTHALAGTQKVSSTEDVVIWDDKNLQEQAIVFNYIKDNFEKKGIEAVSNILETIRSGELAHLRSEFLFDVNDITQIGEVLTMLHPTPAVCGYPKDKAFNIIRDNEGYDRSYYSGFVGPYNIESKTDLYVNLRCMQIFSDTLRLYAGGGLMPQSDIASEWQETEYKLQTITSIL